MQSVQNKETTILTKGRTTRVVWNRPGTALRKWDISKHHRGNRKRGSHCHPMTLFQEQIAWRLDSAESHITTSNVRSRQGAGGLEEWYSHNNATAIGCGHIQRVEILELVRTSSILFKGICSSQTSYVISHLLHRLQYLGATYSQGAGESIS